MKKEVKILGLSYSQSQLGSYVVVLSEKKGGRKIPIIIKQSDAQQIALKLEGMTTARPLTCDLFKNLSDFFLIDIQEVFVYKLVEGVFYTKIIATNGLDEVELDCSIGDALSIATTFDCQIYVDSEILDSTGIEIGDDGHSDNWEDEVEEPEEEKRSPLTVEDLEHMMQDAIENEEYEIAAELRDRINKVKGEN
jgi:hypothetical protein